MRPFTKTASSIWVSPRFVALEDDPRLLIHFCISGPHQSACGAFRLPDAYAASDLKWTIDRYIAARSNLIAEGFVVFDEITSEFFVNKWFKHSPPINPAHRKGIHTALAQVASERVRSAASDELKAVEDEIAARNEAKVVADGKPGRATVQSLTETARMRALR